MRIKCRDVKHSTWYGKPYSFITKQDEQIEVKECDNCYGNGNVIRQDTEFKDEMEWEFIDCPKCDGEFYIEK